MVTKVTNAVIPQVLQSSAVTTSHNDRGHSRMALSSSRFTIVGGLNKQQIPIADLESSCVAVVGQVKPVTRASSSDMVANVAFTGNLMRPHMHLNASDCNCNCFACDGWNA